MRTKSTAPDAPTSERGGSNDLLVGRYRIECLLGEGGIARVYRATNVMVDKVVAIKMLRSEFVDDEDMVSRFMREGRIANRVHHPNIVDVLDVGTTAQGTPFMVQEFLEGESMETYLQRHDGKLSPRTAVDRLLPIIDAIAHAHERGIIHRDLKPDNIFFVDDGDFVIPKVLDFGISKAKWSDPNLKATTLGTLMGSPAYMAPEAILHTSPTDARVDVWSLGVIFYEVLSGDLPFNSESVNTLFAEVCSRDVTPLSSVAPHVPASLARIVDTCLRRDPEARFKNAGELARAVRDAMNLSQPMRRRGEVPRSSPRMSAYTDDTPPLYDAASKCEKTQPQFALNPVTPIARATVPTPVERAALPTDVIPQHATPRAPSSASHTLRVAVIAACCLAGLAVGVRLELWRTAHASPASIHAPMP